MTTTHDGARTHTLTRSSLVVDFHLTTTALLDACAAFPSTATNETVTNR